MFMGRVPGKVVSMFRIVQFCSCDGSVSAEMKVLNNQIIPLIDTMEKKIEDLPFRKNPHLDNARYNLVLSDIQRLEGMFILSYDLDILTYEQFLSSKEYIQELRDILLDYYFPLSDDEILAEKHPITVI